MDFRLITKQFVPAAACLGFVGFGAAVAAAGPAQAAVPSLPCPGNVSGSVVVQGCLPSTNASADALEMRGPNQVPKVKGIPCTGSNTGTCIGLSRLPSADAPQPDTSVRHSP
ncbi:intersectin-EH binding protein Ibp1 [Mycolicibacterium moriokaense]|nr:intersectin-EH binding protein Ibp1 [Mycolicibacterium moriokaense]